MELYTHISNYAHSRCTIMEVYYQEKSAKHYIIDPLRQWSQLKDVIFYTNVNSFHTWEEKIDKIFFQDTDVS